MSVAGAEVTAELSHPRERRRGRPSRRISMGTAAVVVAIGVAVVASNQFGGPNQANSGVVDNPNPTSLAAVSERPLSSQTLVSATLGYAGSYSVVNQASGTITSLPAVGQLVNQGDILYQVSGSPVVLLYGSIPAYRTLSEGASGSDVTGPDVQQLNADLVALGYVTSSELNSTSNQFGYWTKVGVEKLQAHLGVTQNGTLALGQVVFLPTAARVTALGALSILGASAQPGSAILTASSTARVVTISLDAAQQATVKAGDAVVITLPSRKTTPGIVFSVGTVATAPSSSGSNTSPTVAVNVTPTDPAATGSLDQAPVQVSITTASAKSAIVVPVNALLALSGGGYAVETVSAAGIHHLVPVSLGLFDDADGLVQIIGSSLTAGQHVVVPSS